MTYYPDLAPCGYFDHSPEVCEQLEKALSPERRELLAELKEPSAPYLLAVGWLDDQVPRRYSDVRNLEPVIAALVRLWTAHVDPWQVTFGYHGCRMCRTPDKIATELNYGGARLVLGNGYITVPSNQALFVAPSLVIHYILAHEYQPPEVFCQAVLRCPEPTSRSYIEALQRNGPPRMRSGDSKEPFRPLGLRAAIAKFLELPPFGSTPFAQHLRKWIREL